MPTYRKVATYNDDFNRADNPDLGTGYTAYLSSLQVVNNQCRAAGLTSERSEGVTTLTLNANHYAKITVATIISDGEHFSLFIRAAQPPTRSYYECLVRRVGATQIYSVAAGVRTSLNSVADPGWVATDTLEFWAVATALTAFRNGVQILTASDGTYTSGTIGLMIHPGNSSEATIILDDLEAGNLIETAEGTVPQDEMKYMVKLRRGY